MMLHSPDVLGSLPYNACLGRIDPSTRPEPEEPELAEEDIRKQEYRSQMPRVEDFLLLEDFEFWASRVLSTTAWAYYRSAADEERSKFTL